jgi:hypothetical protein
MVVRDEQCGGTHKDCRLEHFARMHGCLRQGTDGHEVDTDDAMLGVQATGDEVLAVQPVEEWPEDRGGIPSTWPFARVIVPLPSQKHRFSPTPHNRVGVRAKGSGAGALCRPAGP